MPTLLHIFEPRYRLMLRRVLQQPVPEFGMVMYPSSESHTVSYGTMLRVRSAKILSDGRSVIDTWGTHRFRILERGEQDGYIVGTVETIQDLSPEMEREIERNATLPIPPRTPPFVPISPPKSSPTLMALSPPPSTSNRSVPPLAALHPLPPHIPSIRPTGTTMHHPHPPRTLSPSPSIASISTIGSTSSSAHSIRSAPGPLPISSHPHHHANPPEHSHRGENGRRDSRPRQITSRFSVSSLTRPFSSTRPTNRAAAAESTTPSGPTLLSVPDHGLSSSSSSSPSPTVISPTDPTSATHFPTSDETSDDTFTRQLHDTSQNEQHRTLNATGNSSSSSSSSSTTYTTLHPFNYPLEPTTEDLVATCHIFVGKLQRVSSPIVLQRLSLVGPMPNDVSLLSFWIAQLLPIEESEKAKLLPIRSPRLRLRLVVHWIDQFNAAWWFSGCVIC
ncbi:hypothetical protein FRC19_005745 [Serendipita sp. 401]|nr:hypothetical protein FRC19_005745 [Serendipita sp. 401]